MLAEVYDFDRRELALQHSARQPYQPVASAPRIGERLDRRSGRAEDHRTISEAAQRNRKVAGVVANPVLLLVGSVVLFIHDDEPEVIDRGEDSRARADYDPHVAA
jgi:hypothetical protein